MPKYSREQKIKKLSDPSVSERFLAGFIIADSGCFNWIGYKDENGYGVLAIGGGFPLRVHAVAWFIEHGVLLPRGRVLDHLCRNTSCCNVEHLEDVTHAENIRRGYALRTHCPSGHAYDEENTCISGGWRYCRACAREKANRLGPGIYARNKANGICNACMREKSAPERTMCTACLAKHAERNRKAWRDAHPPKPRVAYA